MSTIVDEDFKRWTAKRKAALVMDIIQGKTSTSGASRAFDLPPSEVEEWVEEGTRSGIRLAHQAAGHQRAAGGVRRRDVAVACQKTVELPAGRRREMIETVKQGLESEGVSVPMTKLCRWFEILRRTLYYKPTKAAPKV